MTHFTLKNNLGKQLSFGVYVGNIIYLIANIATLITYLLSYYDAGWAIASWTITFFAIVIIAPMLIDATNNLYRTCHPKQKFAKWLTISNIASCILLTICCKNITGLVIGLAVILIAESKSPTPTKNSNTEAESHKTKPKLNQSAINAAGYLVFNSIIVMVAFWFKQQASVPGNAIKIYELTTKHH